MRWEISPVLSRIQGLKVHAQTNMVKLDQRLIGLEANSVADGGLDIIREELMEARQKTQSLWETVYGSAVTKGGEAVLYGLAQASLNGFRGAVMDWDEDWDRWAVKIGGKNLLVKAGNLFAMDGLVAKWTFVEQELLRSA